MTRSRSCHPRILVAGPPASRRWILADRLGDAPGREYRNQLPEVGRPQLIDGLFDLCRIWGSRWTRAANTTRHQHQGGPIMSTRTIWIVVAVVAVVLIAALVVYAVGRASRRRRQRHAEQLREQTRLETAKLERREALAQETAAKARAAQAEAEVKAAEATRLQERAAAHQSDVATSREQLEEQRKRADSIDPNVRTKRPDRPTPDGDQGHAEEPDKPAESATNAGTVRHDPTLDANNYR